MSLRLEVRSMLGSDVPISKTKIILPKRRLDLLSRARLLEILYERLERRLIIISAAAGYGKTSLLIDLAHHSDLPFCWLALDNLDREPQRFIACFIAALNERFPGFGKRSRSVLGSLTSLDDGMERLLVTLINEIYDDIHEHFVIVLDDFHLLDESPQVLYFVNRFVQLVGENCHVAISSRTLPELRDIPQLVAHDDIGGLDFSDLSFRPEEIQALLAQNRQIHLSDEDARKLVDATEGWITGLQFTDLSALSSEAGALTTPKKVGVTVFDYLGQQVLEQQPRDLQQFLLRSSILEEFDGSVCQAVLGPLYAKSPDWSGLIQTITQKNLFTLPVGADGQWLRYHHLFRDYLQNRYRAQFPEEVDPVLRRLAQFHEAGSQWEKAYQIYRQLGDTEALAGMIERAGIPMYQHAMLILESWLKALPPSVVNSRPGLLSLRGNIETLQGNAAEGVRLFDRAIAIFREQQQPEGLALALVRRASTYHSLGRYDEAIRDADEVMKTSAARDDLQWIHADALRVKAGSLYRQGRTLEALNYFRQAYDICVRVNDSASIPVVLMDTGMAYSAIGEYAHAKDSYERALKIWRQDGNLSSQAALLNNFGFLHQQLGEYEQAAPILEEGLLCAQQSGYKRMEALISLSLGDVYTDVEDFEIAGQNYLQVRDLIDQLGDAFLANYLHIATINLALLKQHSSEAGELIQRSAASIEARRSNYESGFLHLLKGRLALQKGEPSAAVPELKAAKVCFSEDGREMESIWSSVWLAAALYGMEEHAAAREEIKAAVPSANQVPHAAIIAARQARDYLPSLRKDAELRSHLRGLFDKADRLQTQLPPVRRQLRRLAHSIEMPTPSLVIKAFGAGQVWVNGKLLTASDWQTQSVRELFFYFMAARRPMPSERIGAELWPGAEVPSKFKMRFKNEVYRLRRAVGLDTILFQNDLYGFNPAVDHEYDVEAFEAYLAKARSAAKPAEQIGFYERAVKLAQGKYLEDISSSWILPDQERLHQAFLNAELSLGRLHFAQGHTPQAIEACEHALGRDRTFEAACRLEMEIYDRLADKRSVVHVYQACETAMKEVFDMPPSAETRELYLKLTS